ncbi:hypothetical protein GCM10009551_056100 [Nocardiopsis tropica]
MERGRAAPAEVGRGLEPQVEAGVPLHGRDAPQQHGPVRVARERQRLTALGDAPEVVQRLRQTSVPGS